MKNEIRSENGQLIATIGEDDIKELSLLESLKQDQKELLRQKTKELKNGNIGTYKNLVNALSTVTYLIHEEENKYKWEQKWSKYETDGVQEIAVWEQKGDEIREHKRFKVDNFNDFVLLGEGESCIRTTGVSYYTDVVDESFPFTIYLKRSGELEKLQLNLNIGKFKGQINTDNPYRCKVLVNNVEIGYMKDGESINVNSNLFKKRNIIDFIPNFDGKITVGVCSKEKH